MPHTPHRQKSTPEVGADRRNRQETEGEKIAPPNRGRLKNLALLGLWVVAWLGWRFPPLNARQKKSRHIFQDGRLYKLRCNEHL